MRRVLCRMRSQAQLEDFKRRLFIIKTQFSHCRERRRNMQMNDGLMRNFGGVSENWFRRLHLPVSNLLTIFDRLSGWLGQMTPSSSQRLFISVSCFYLCCFFGRVDAIFNNCSYKKDKCWSLDAFFVFKCQ